MKRLNPKDASYLIRLARFVLNSLPHFENDSDTFTNWHDQLWAELEVRTNLAPTIPKANIVFVAWRMALEKKRIAYIPEIFTFWYKGMDTENWSTFDLAACAWDEAPTMTGIATPINSSRGN